MLFKFAFGTVFYPSIPVSAKGNFYEKNHSNPMPCCIAPTLRMPDILRQQQTKNACRKRREC